MNNVVKAGVTQKRTPTFERTIWWSTAIVVSSALIVSGLIESYFTYKQSVSGARDMLVSEASWANALVTERLARTDKSLREVARLPWGALDYDRQALLGALGALHTSDASFESAGLFVNGKSVAQMRGVVVADATDQSLDWARAINLKGVQYDTVFCGDVSRGVSTMPTLPCYTRSTVPNSIVAANIRTSGLSEALAKINVARDTRIAVVDTKGRLLAHSVPAYADGDATLVIVPLMTGVRHQVDWFEVNGVTVLRAFDRNDRSGFAIFAEYPRSKVLSEIPGIVVRTLGLLVGTISLALLYSRVRARQLASPAVELAKTARALETGDFSARVTTAGVIELQQLGGAFNSMADKLQRSHETMEREVAEKTRDLANANMQLEIVSKHKSDFLAHMSHELRTPLNAVIGFSEMLKAQYFGPLNEKQAEYVKDINDSGQHLLALINEILDLAKVEAGRMEVVRSNAHVPIIVEACCTLVSERFQRKRQVLDAEVSPSVSFWYLDERKFKQCLLNLLSNANKFTPEGGRVGLRVFVEEGSAPLPPGGGGVGGEGDGGIGINVGASNDHPPLPNPLPRGERGLAPSLVVQVTDTGVGIAADALPKLFSEFYQVASTDSSAAAQAVTEGTGLGLALTKKFVELHGGTVEVTSVIGEGSVFTLRFPAQDVGDSA